MGEFWDDMKSAFVGNSVSVDHFLSGKKIAGPEMTVLQNLTQQAREANALNLPVEAGTRVAFQANIGSVLTYDDCPGDQMGGTVITVKSAGGKVTHQDGRVFISWDDGVFRPILAEHLRLAKDNKKTASSVRMVVANLGDISNLFSVVSSGSSDELVHRATKDLWSFRQDGAQFVIERLFNTNGEPIKV